MFVVNSKVFPFQLAFSLLQKKSKSFTTRFQQNFTSFIGLLFISVQLSDNSAFCRNFAVMLENECQTNINSSPKGLIWDANSQQHYAEVYLSTLSTATVQHTKQVLFEIKYLASQNRGENAKERADDCSANKSGEYYSVNLHKLLPGHIPALGNFTILLPLPRLGHDGKSVDDVRIRSHAKDACHGSFSSYLIGAKNVQSKFVSVQPLKECPNQMQIVSAPSNISGPLGSSEKIPSETINNHVSDPNDDPNSVSLQDKPSWIHNNLAMPYVVSGLVVLFIFLFFILLACVCFKRNYTLKWVYCPSDTPRDRREQNAHPSMGQNIQLETGYASGPNWRPQIDGRAESDFYLSNYATPDNFHSWSENSASG